MLQSNTLYWINLYLWNRITASHCYASIQYTVSHCDTVYYTIFSLDVFGHATKVQLRSIKVCRRDFRFVRFIFSGESFVCKTKLRRRRQKQTDFCFLFKHKNGFRFPFKHQQNRPRKKLVSVCRYWYFFLNCCGSYI